MSGVACSCNKAKVSCLRCVDELLCEGKTGKKNRGRKRVVWWADHKARVQARRLGWGFPLPEEEGPGPTAPPWWDSWEGKPTA